MKKFIAVFAFFCLGNTAGNCASCLSATGKLLDSIDKIDRAERERAQAQRAALKNEELDTRLEIAKLQSRAIRLEAAKHEAPPRVVERDRKTDVAAVFELEPSGLLQNDRAKALTELLHLALAEKSNLRLVPLEEVRSAIAGAQADSYDACIAEECQIELGKALAATKAIIPVLYLTKDAPKEECLIGLISYDLQREAADWAKSTETSCDPEDLGDALEDLAGDL